MNEFYNSGADLPVIHPDQNINKDILIEVLCTKLDIARTALGCAAGMNVVTPAAQSMKRQVIWALDETHPARLTETHNNHG